MVTTTTITGEGLFPDNAAPTGFIEATLTGFDTDGSLMAPVTRRAAVTAGVFSLALWPNTRGRRDTAYDFRLILPVTGAEPARVETILLGSVRVPQASTRTLVSLLDERDDQITPAAFNSLQVALLAASAGRLFETAALGYASAAVAVGDVFLAPAGGIVTLFKKASPTTGTSLGALFPQGSFADGSGAAPGITFASDPDTGLLRPAPNQLGFAVGGAQIALLSATAFQVDVLLTGLATMQSGWDTTEGRLARVRSAGGIFGWGTASSTDVIANLDSTTEPSGLKRVDATTTGTYPAGWSGTAGYLLTQRTNPNNSLMTLIAQTGLPIAWQRKCIGGVMQPWYPVSQPTLGTVSQTGGAPTGAIIERATNANGEYVRYADGSQICTHTLTAASGAGTVWTFPASFAAAPVVTGTAVATVMSCVMLDAAPGTASATLSARDKADARRADSMRLAAIGRWF